jgi:dephospho-CoA kinase
VASRSLAAIEGDLAHGLIVDGLRSPAEVEVLRQRATGGALLIAVVAPRRTRHERLASQNPTRVDREWIERQDQHNLRLGVGDCVAMADCYVIHAGSLDRANTVLAVEAALSQLYRGEQ